MEDESARFPDGTAPLTRSQRAAVLLTPGCLIMSALHVWDGLNGPAELPGMLYASLAIGALIIGAYGFFWLSEGEQRDERELLIELKSIRVCAVVLILGNLLILPQFGNRLHEAISALVFFSLAASNGSILFYSRRSA
jgi:hypothetical protein